MHEHIKDVARRFAKEGFLGITFEPYAREGGVMQLPDQAQVMKVANSFPDAQAMGDLDAFVEHAKQHPAASADRNRGDRFLQRRDVHPTLCGPQRRDQGGSAVVRANQTRA